MNRFAAIVAIAALVNFSAHAADAPTVSLTAIDIQNIAKLAISEDRAQQAKNDAKPTLDKIQAAFSPKPAAPEAPAK